MIAGFDGGQRGGDRDSGVPLEALQRIGAALSEAPPNMTANAKIVRQLQVRNEAVRTGEGIPWAFAEALAFGTLACDGVNIRFSGQDTPRGAFSQRHFVLIDQETGETIQPFSLLQPKQGRCEVIGSPLSEYSVLGFEYGYALEATGSLVVWEAQFGDFANVAQVVIDQFVASAEDKWLDRAALVLMLPHGLEGQGPDHSSGRIERFLQMCARGNMTVANCSTPANLFHLLRRQAAALPRRPLVVFTPKSLLRHRLAVSRLTDFATGTSFMPVIGASPSTTPTHRVVLCSGKFYYELLAGLGDEVASGVALVRLEQLHPFPTDALLEELKRFPNATVVWCQEEPENMGAWTYIDRKVESILRNIGNLSSWPNCVSRPENASTAIGTADEHAADQTALVARALGFSEVRQKTVVTVSS